MGDQSKRYTGSIKLLYIAYEEGRDGYANIGVAKKTFEDHWYGYNKSRPEKLRMREFFSIRLPESDARMVEKHIKSNYSRKNSGGWVEWPAEKLKEIVVGLIFMRCREARRDLRRVVDGLPQIDHPYAASTPSSSLREQRKKDGKCQDCGKDLDNPNNKTRCRVCQQKVSDRDKKRHAEENKDQVPAKYRVANGLCRDCGKKRDDPRIQTRCWACNEAVKAQIRKSKAEREKFQAPVEGRVLVKDRVAHGLCLNCGKRRDDPSIKTRCWACNEAVKEQIKKSRAEKDKIRPQTDG